MSRLAEDKDKERDAKSYGLSGRTEKFMVTLLPYLNAHMEAMANAYHPEENPRGAITMAVAENRLMAAELEAKMKDCAKAISAESLFYVCNRGDFTGMPVFQEALAKFLAERLFKIHPPRVDSDNLIVRAGCTPILSQLGIWLCEEDDSILVPAPYYAAFIPDFMQNGKVHVVNVYGKNKGMCMELREELLQEAYDRAVKEGHPPKAVLLCNPNNPTGIFYSDECLLTAAKWCRSKGMHLVVDEVYGLSTIDENVSEVKTPGTPLYDGMFGFYGNLATSLADGMLKLSQREAPKLMCNIEQDSKAFVIKTTNANGVDITSNGATDDANDGVNNSIDDFSDGEDDTAGSVRKCSSMAITDTETATATQKSGSKTPSSKAQTSRRGSEFRSIVNLLDNNLGEDIHVIWGLSKDFGASGMRVGCLYTQNEGIRRASRGWVIASNVSNLTQEIWASLLSDKAFIDYYLEENTRRLSLGYKMLKRDLEPLGIDIIKPGGGLYVFADFRKYLKEDSFEGEEVCNPTHAWEFKCVFRTMKCTHVMSLVQGTHTYIYMYSYNLLHLCITLT